MLKLNDEAPYISCKNQNGKIITSAYFKEKKCILFFYPKAMTPGCTNEVCNLKENYNSLKNANYILLGVSCDSVERQKKFQEKHNLPFDLLADEDKTIVTNFSVWGEKKFMGRTYNGIHRKTFIINEENKIEQIIEKVNTKNHTNQILSSIKKE